MKRKSALLLATLTVMYITASAPANTTRGSLLAWGENNYGECNLPDGNDFVAVSAGVQNSLALRADGSLVAWGRNDYGECNVPDGSDFTAIGMGRYHGLALKSDGSVVAWGIDTGTAWDFGQVTAAPEGNDFVAIAVGVYHGFAFRADGSLEA